jgi:signal peptidase I
MDTAGDAGYSTVSMPGPSKLPLVSAIVAFVLGALFIVAAVFGSFVFVASALIPWFAGIGILRKRVWAAWGYSLYCAGQTLLACIFVLRGHSEILPLLFSALWSIAVASLFFFAGKTLDSEGGVRGWSWPWIAVASINLVLLFFEPFSMPSASMESTILIGDRLLVRTLPRPVLTRDDLAVFEYPLDRREVYVKRILGIPGDHIRLANKTVYRNGAALSERYAKHMTDYTDNYRDNFPNAANTHLPPEALNMLEKHLENGEIVVPAGQYFVLGDNRDDSSDSRYWGFVPFDHIIGKPVMIYDSQEPLDTVSPQVHSFLATNRTRWSRIFKLL